MAVITSENRSAWQALSDSLASQFPGVGKRVRVIESRKYKGIEGLVTWHGPDRFAKRYYESEAQAILHDMQGRRFFRIRIQPDSGEQFFVGADKVEVIG